MPPWWWKVFAVRDVIRQDPNPDTLLVLWMDADAVLTPCGRMDPVQLALSDVGHCMWISPDAPPAQYAFNAGVFLIRGSVKGRQLMDAWCALYRPEHWQRVHNNPTTSVTNTTVLIGEDRQSSHRPWRWQHVVGSWGGEAFEQGSFCAHILPQAAHYGIVSLPYYVFNEVHCNAPHHHSLAVHMYGQHAAVQCEEPQQCVGRSLHWQPILHRSWVFVVDHRLLVALLTTLVIAMVWKWSRNEE